MKRHSKGAVIAAAAAVVLLIAAAALFIWSSQPQYEIEVPSSAPVTSFTPSPEPTPTDSETPSPTPTPLTYKEVLEEPEDGLPTDKKIALICLEGKNSYMAQNRMKRYGYSDVNVVEGGTIFNFELNQKIDI